MVSATMVPMNRLEELRRRHQAADQGGGPERQARQHKEGKLSARERIELLLDENSFEEPDKLITHRCRNFGMEEQRDTGAAGSRPCSALGEGIPHEEILREFGLRK